MTQQSKKTQNAPNPNIQEIKDTMRRPNLRIIGIEESEDSQLKGPENIFNKIIEENFPNLKKEITINVQEAYRTPKRFEQKKKILPLHNNQSTKCTEQRENIKTCKRKRPSKYIKANLSELHKTS